MVAGTVAVADDGTVTGSDYALALYTADAATLSVPAPPTLGQTTPPYCPEIPATANDIKVYAAALITMQKEAARRATAYATATVAYFHANAFALVAAGHPGAGDGLQTSQAAGTATTAPSADKYIPIV
jgi:hypothetical protein